MVRGRLRTTAFPRNPLAHLKNSDAFRGLVRAQRAFYFGSRALWGADPCRFRPMRLNLGQGYGN